MYLRCPHCERRGDHTRSDFFGDWVVCPSCELPFAWREAQIDELAADYHSNGAGNHAPTPARAEASAED